MQRSIKVQREYSSYVCRTSIQCHYRPTVFSFAPGLVSITLRKNQTLKDLLEPSMCDWKWSTKVAVWVKPWVCVCVASERLHQHREEQRQVFGSTDGQFVCGVVMNDFRDGVERRTVLSQDELPITRLRELHMHEPVTAPAERQSHWVCMLLFMAYNATVEMCQLVEIALYCYFTQCWTPCTSEIVLLLL